MIRSTIQHDLTRNAATVFAILLLSLLGTSQADAQSGLTDRLARAEISPSLSPSFPYPNSVRPPIAIDDYLETMDVESVQPTVQPSTTPGVAPDATDTEEVASNLPPAIADWIDPQRITGSLQLAISVSMVGLLPALLLLTTSYIRISIVLSLLRQAFGSQQLLPAQVSAALALCCTGLIMWPTWTAVYEAADGHIATAATDARGLEQAWHAGVVPIRDFMIRQIDERGNAEDIHLFLAEDPASPGYPATYDEVPLRALFPAYLVSELKTAFEIGFRIYLPFLVIDLVIAAFTTSLGMFMLPPAMVSLPLKLLLFLVVDGWHLVIEMLIKSFV